MRCWLRKNWLIAITCISMALNIGAAFLLYQGYHSSVTAAADDEQSVKKTEPLDYETFMDEWGRAWLGLEVCEVTPEIAARARLYRPEGAVVRSVVPGSPADKADIEAGDVIVSFNGRKIRKVKQLQGDLLGSEIGMEVYMCVVKRDYRITVYAVPIERPSYLPRVMRAVPWFGAEVSEVLRGSEEGRRLERVGKAGGILVTAVAGDSPAAEAGLETDDIIMSFNFRKTVSLREFLSDLAGAEPGDTIHMCIMRGDIRKTIYVTLGRKPRFHEI